MRSQAAKACSSSSNGGAWAGQDAAKADLDNGKPVLRGDAPSEIGSSYQPPVPHGLVRFTVKHDVDADGSR